MLDSGSENKGQTIQIVSKIKGQIRDKLVWNWAEIRDSTSLIFTVSLIKNTECTPIMIIKSKIFLDTLLYSE